MAATYDGSIRINTKIDTSGVTTGLSKITSGLKSFASAVSVAFAVTAVVNFGEACIEVASDLNEVQNVVETTFGSSTSIIEEFAETAAESYGLSTLAAKEYTGTMGAMLKSMGFATDDAANMSTTLASLAGDMASFYNLDTDEAFSKLRSGISGETEPLKELGINLSEANLEAYALSQGITTAYSSLSEQNKALLRYNYILDATSDAQGDFSKTSDSWANQVRILQLNFETLKATLGGAFINVLTPVLQVVNTLISRLNTLATAFANFISIVTGNSVEVSSTVSDATDATDSLTESTDESTDALEESGTAASSAAKSLESFDELNTMSDSSSSGSSSSSSDSDLVDDISSYSADETGSTLAQEIQDNLDEIAIIVCGAALALGAILVFSGVAPLLGLALMATGAVGLAAEIYANWDYIAAALRESIRGVTTLISGALLVFGAILTFSGAAPGIGIGMMVLGAAGLAAVAAVNWDYIIDELQGPIGEIIIAISAALLVLGAIFAFSGAAVKLGIGMMLLGAAGLATEAVLNWDYITGQVKESIKDVVEIVSVALLALGAVLTFSGVAPRLGLGLLIAGAVGLAASAVLDWDEISGKVGDKIEEITIIASAALLALGVVLTLTGVATGLGVKLMALGAVGLAAVAVLNWDTVTTALKGTLGKIITIAGAAMLALGVILCLTGVALPLGIALMAAGAVSLVTVTAINWDTAKNSVKTALGDVFAVAGMSLLAIGLLLCLTGGGIPLGIALMLAGAGSLGVAASIGDSPLVQYVKDTINSIISVVETGINYIIDKINTISWDIPDWVPSIGGQTWGFSISHVSIPRLAQGAVIPPNREFVAVLGDQKSGVNIETPLDTMIQAFKAALSEGGYGGTANVTITFQGELAAVGKALAPSVTVAQNAAARSAGKTLLNV